MPSLARLFPRPEPRPVARDEAKNTDVGASARPVLVDLGAVGGRIPWLPGARRWRAELSPAARVADLGQLPLAELAFRLGPASEWAIVVGSGGELAARRLFEAAEVRFTDAIVPRCLVAAARAVADRVWTASTERDRWRAACGLLRARARGQG